MTDEIITIPEGETTHPEAPEAPETPEAPEPTLTLHMVFDDGLGTDKSLDTYANKLDQPATLTPEQYAKEVAERVERTVLLHLGALPVLAKVDPA